MLKLPKKDKIQFALLGSGYDLCNISDILLKQEFKKPIIVTHSKKFHMRDKKLMKNTKRNTDIFSYSKEKNLKLIEEDDINSPKLIKKLLDLGVNLIFSHACRSIIKKEFLNSFQNLVFNIHPSFLPEERGAATFSWRILNDQKFVAATIHQIDEGIDSGPIIFQKKKILSKKELTVPLDYDIKTTKMYELIFKDFLKKIQKNQKIITVKQNEKNSSYLPRLYTEINGAIDFDWNTDQIERFVRAFSYPYPGAFTFINKQKICILECFTEKKKINFHPFIAGRVNKKFSDGSVRIIINNGFMRITKIRVKNQIMNPTEVIKINDVLFTPRNFLDKSRTTTISVKNMK
jgi:methionyl-tRNA formyltransferase